jgi:outer membrane protein OmpA-like peptidoglycan-associated protein
VALLFSLAWACCSASAPSQTRGTTIRGDEDLDGIVGEQDLCPQKTEDLDGFEDEDGCPEEDNDGDGIMDIHDKCPNQPEVFNGREDADGCPDMGDVILGPSCPEQFKLDGEVYLDLSFCGTQTKFIVFDQASAIISLETQAIVERLAFALGELSEYSLLALEGHADSAEGNSTERIELSANRAKNVANALSEKGVSWDRIISVGLSNACPASEGEAAVVLNHNRRVSIKIMATDGHPTGLKLGCEKARQEGLIPGKFSGYPYRF